MGRMIVLHSVDTWTHLLQQAKESNKLVVIDFTASWCPPCRAIAPFFQELAKRFLNVVFLKVDVDELQSVAEECKVEAMPTFLFIKDGQTLATIVGARKDEHSAVCLSYDPSVFCLLIYILSIWAANGIMKTYVCVAIKHPQDI